MTRSVVLAAGIAAIVVVSAASVAIGSRDVSLLEVWQALTDPQSQGIAADAVRSRIPRTVLGLLAGAALAVSGALMQAVTRNPLADPGLLGVNSGSALAIVVGITFGGLTTAGQYVWLALAGGVITAATVWIVGSLGPGRATPLKLALAGAVMTAVLSSFTSALLLPRADALQVFQFWRVGSIGRGSFDSMSAVAPVLIAGAVLTVLAARPLNTLALGDELATGLGGHVRRTQVIAGLAAVLLAAGSTALAGPIGFVGLVVPHAVRAAAGADQRWTLAYSAVFGPVLLVAADVVGRVITRPSDVEVGIITAIIGAPAFIWLVRRTRSRSL